MATNFVKATYTEIIDLQTINGQTSIVGIHTPTGAGPYSKLLGYFHNFRKYIYKGISKIVMVPAANLPVDPLGLTGVQGTTDLMDPRDALNPIMFHGCHGEHLTQVIDQFYGNHGGNVFDVNGRANTTLGFVSDSADKIDNGNNASSVNYYRALTDPHWKKFGIQSGVQLRNLHPLTWRMARSMPMLPNFINPGEGMLRTSQDITTSDAVPTNSAVWPYLALKNAPNSEAGESDVRQFVQEFTNGVSRLGWLPTTTYAVNGEVTINVLPKLFMGMLVLPPAYNVEQFFRLSIRHVFCFRDFTASTGLLGQGSVSLPGLNNLKDGITGYYNWIDYTDPDGKKISEVSTYSEGTTLDCVGASSEVVSDGVL